MKFILYIFLILILNPIIGQEFLSECEMGIILAKEHFNSGKKYWGKYDTIQSNNELIIRAFEKHILDKFQIELTPIDLEPKYFYDVVDINYEDLFADDDFDLRNSCYFDEIKKLAFEKFGKEFLTNEEEYILSKVDSILDSHPEHYFQSRQLNSENLSNYDLFTPTIPDFTFDTIHLVCAEELESLLPKHRALFKLYINRSGNLVKISPLIRPESCWQKELCRIVKENNFKIQIAMIDGYPVNYEYILPVNIKFE